MTQPYTSGWEDAVFVTLLDTQTGRTKSTREWGIAARPWPSAWWARGNGSCDCNRELVFDCDVEETGTCLGSARYLVVGVETPDGTPLGSAFVDEMNEDYPAALREMARNFRVGEVSSE